MPRSSNRAAARRSSLALALLLAGLAPPDRPWPGPAVAAAATPSFASGFAGQKALRLRLSWRVSDGWSSTVASESCTTTDTFSAGLEANVSIKLVATRVSNKGVYQWRSERGSRPEGTIAYRYQFVGVKRCKDQPEQRYAQEGSGGGVGDGSGRFDLDGRDGTFRAVGWASAKEGDVTDSVLGKVPGGLTLVPGDTVKELQGRVSAGQDSVDGGAITMPSPLGMAWARKPMTFSWRLEKWEDGEPPEVAVDPDGAFDRWVPTGNLEAPQQPGGRVAVRVRVHEAGNPEKRAKELARLKFTLVEVSREPGTCINWPRESLDHDPDLKLLQEENDGTIRVTDETHAETIDPVMGAQLVVSSLDYGAWGRLKVTAQDEKGRDLKVRVRGVEGAELELPRDKDGNHVADAWEKEQWVEGRPGDADDEVQPAGNGFAGDGLTLYEEYRGFAARKTHERGDPRKKELFVADKTSGQAAGPAVDLFERASGLRIRRLDPEELGASRVVNPNHGKGPHAVNQHGLRLVDGAGGDPEQVATEDVWGPPRFTEEIRLPKGGAWGAGQGLENAAHELGHGVGIEHHGSGAMSAAIWSWKPGEDGSLALWEQGFDPSAQKLTLVGQGKVVQPFYEPPPGGAPVPVTPGTSMSSTGGFGWSDKGQGWKLILYWQEGEFSGDPECLMRYADKQAFRRKADDGRRYLVDQSQTPARSKLCDTQVGTGVNAPYHKPFSRGGDAKAGNCAGQLVVNDLAGGRR